MPTITLANLPRRKLLEEAYRRGLRVPVVERRSYTLQQLVRRTMAYPLHPWQESLCRILARLRDEKGVRLLLAAPPQHGKSIIVSQRLPAWLMGEMPTHRVALATYNIQHSSGFGAVVRDIMAGDVYRRMYPESALKPGTGGERFSTVPRLEQQDGQTSFTGLGLGSGFVGRGADTLIVDDPYKSADEARSEAVNESVWRWWSQTASVRLSAESNVIVMYHPYHGDDLAARLERSGEWECVRFPAIACGDEADPTEREGLRAVGEQLSPLRSLAWLERKQAADPLTFAAQFQLRPRSDTGAFFRVGLVRRVEAPSGPIVERVRAWDIAASPGRGDYTAGVLLGRRADGLTVLDVELGQWAPGEADTRIVGAAQADGLSVPIHLPQDPGSAGVRDANHLTWQLNGFEVWAERVTGDKAKRARPLASQVNAGNVEIVDQPHKLVMTGPYAGMSVTEALLRMMGGFPYTAAKKDGVDALADALNVLRPSIADPDHAAPAREEAARLERERLEREAAIRLGGLSDYDREEGSRRRGRDTL